MEDNCIEETLVNIDRPYLYSVIQYETYGNYCGKELISSYTTINLSQAGFVIIFVLAFSVLFFMAGGLGEVKEGIKKIWH